MDSFRAPVTPWSDAATSEGRKRHAVTAPLQCVQPHRTLAHDCQARLLPPAVSAPSPRQACVDLGAPRPALPPTIPGSHQAPRVPGPTRQLACAPVPEAAVALDRGPDQRPLAPWCPMPTVVRPPARPTDWRPARCRPPRSQPAGGPQPRPPQPRWAQPRWAQPRWAQPRWAGRHCRSPAGPAESDAVAFGIHRLGGFREAHVPSTTAAGAPRSMTYRRTRCSSSSRDHTWTLDVKEHRIASLSPSVRGLRR